MKATHTMTPERDGFRGYYYEAMGAARTILVLIGDDGSDFMDTACAKWLTKTQNCNALCIGLRRSPREAPGVHSWPLEQVEAAVHWAMGHGSSQVGILGMSMQASLALCAAVRMEELSLVIALSPNDFVPWGFHQGKVRRDGAGEWPSGTSAFSWRGKDLPYQPAGLSKRNYWKLFCIEKDQYHEMHSITIFDRSEQTHPITEECFIPVERFRGSLFLSGAADDVMWDSTRYIRRMQTRLSERGFAGSVETFTPRYGTHLLVPQRMLKLGIPVFGDLVSRMFSSGKKHPKECKAARIQLDEKLTNLISEW